MTIDEITNKYGGKFTPENITKNYGGTFTPEAPIAPKTPMPLASNSSNSFGQNLLTSAKDVGTGLLKFGTGFARDTAQTLQGMGQRLISGFGGRPLSEVEATTGFNSLNNNTPEGAGVANTLESKNRGEQVGNVLGTAATLAEPLSGGNAEALYGKAKGAYETFQAGREAKATTESGTKITDMISPKATVKEAKIAQSQGRLVPGKEPTLFKAGTEDTITPSKKTLNASQTIQKNIPNAAKMKPTELYSAVDKNIKETATKLRPQMEATPIKPETIDKINTDWETLKKTQMADAPATEEPNVLKRQAKFEALLKKSGSSSHADLWDTRIAYDDSIPEAIKKANPATSSESQLLQKQEWLDNRDILNQAIESTSKPEFKQMSDMYEAKNGLLSKAKVNTAEMSKINQFLKDNPKVSATLGGATIYEIAKHLGIPLP